jgi:hypothetical protein
MKFPFQPAPQYTAIALAYTNRTLIADLVLPRTPVGERTFKWDEYTKSEMFTVPSTLVGRKGAPNEVEFTAIERTGAVLDYGLDDVVPMEDVMAAQSKPSLRDPVGRAVEGLTELILLDREKRTADLVFNDATYPSGSKLALSGNDRWNKYAEAASDPVADILTAKEGMLMQPNVCVMGAQVWYALRRHPKILASIYPVNYSGDGVITMAQFQDLFEFDQVLVGSAFINSSKPGQTATYGRIWGKAFAMLHQNPLAGLRGTGITFGATAEYDTRIAGTLEEPKVGLRGAVRARVGETVLELVTAADVGYLLYTVID